ncbi:MAG TPA: hypothetical protein VFE14_04250 [Micromonosporaceae bacterium]|nr:hypothetical protein [Micromonosporaceae bacterium]
MTLAPTFAAAATLVMVDLLPSTRAYCDTRRHAPPILVIDTGSTEIQLTLPADRVTPADIRIVDDIVEALAAQRTALVARLR